MGRSRKEREEGYGWEVIQRSLDSYQPERLATLLREYLTPRVPPRARSLPGPLREELRKGVEALLSYRGQVVPEDTFHASSGGGGNRSRTGRFGPYSGHRLPARLSL